MKDAIYDAHVHFGPSTQWVPYINPEVTIEDVLKEMDRYKIQKSVVFPNPHVGDKYPELNDLVAGAEKKYSSKIIGFGRVDPRRGGHKGNYPHQGIGFRGCEAASICRMFST